MATVVALRDVGAREYLRHTNSDASTGRLVPTLPWSRPLEDRLVRLVYVDRIRHRLRRILGR